VTDFVVHPFWIYKNIDAYAVATPEMRAALIAKGIEPDRVHIDGIPVQAAFGDRTRSRAQVRAALGLDPQRPVVMVMGGGLGLGPIGASVRALTELGRDLTAVVIVGRNEALRRRVEESARTVPFEMRALGFVDTVADYMRASDVLLTKPGGLTSSEALSAELPMILVKPLPGQEERNARYLIGRGAALRAGRDLAATVARVLDESTCSDALQLGMAELRKPDAARSIAERIIALGSGERAMAAPA
jgi:processive 1,2-diacylglycerol beta-glucosyltransferase